MTKFLTVSFNEVGEGSEGTAIKQSESGYITKYRDNLASIAKSRDWKHSGEGAEFTRSYNEHAHEDLSGHVCDVCAYEDGSCLYSARVGRVSGVIIKDRQTGAENHLLHSNSQVFGLLEYNSHSRTLLMSATNGGITSDIVTYSVANNDLRAVTSGDSVDEFPTYSKADGSILFSSRGVGRNADMKAVAFSDSEILQIKKDGEVEVLLSEPGFDLIAPRDDSRGNLYYLRKPSKKPRRFKGAGNILLDILLLPFWLFYGLFKVIMFLAALAKKSDKKDKKDNDPFSVNGGENPSVNREDNSVINLYGEDISLSKKSSNKGKDDDDGIAPEHFELWCKTPDGKKEKVRAGVLGFDINANGDILLTNGRRAILRTANGEEKTIGKSHVILRIHFDETYDLPFDAFSPF